MKIKQICSILLLISVFFAFCACEDGTADDGGASSAHVFAINGNELAIHAPADRILSELGEPIKRGETGSCAFGGPDRVYEYSGLQIQTYSQSAEGEQYFLLISLMDDSYVTPEGIRIGDSAAKVISAYGEPSEQTDGYIRYTHGGSETQLQFLLRDGKVTNIQYENTKKQA